MGRGACYCAESYNCPTCADTPAPTISAEIFECPESCKVYYQGCVGMYCNCFDESLIESTTTSVETALGLDDGTVKVKSYMQVTRRRRRLLDEVEWEIMYEIGLDESQSSEWLMADLKKQSILSSIATSISADLNINLQKIETTSVGEDDPTES